MLFDLVARKFYIFGLVFWPQDIIYLTVLLIISAYSLFLFTAVAGRLWCGYACPQTVYTEIFMWIERKVEGDRMARMKLDKRRHGARKLGLKAAKHGLWIALALWTGFTFVGYFTPIRAHGARCWSGGAGSVGDLLDPVLRLRDLRQRRLDARAGVQVHVPLRPLPERDVRPRHADHHLRRRARRAARRAQRSVDHKAKGLGDCVDCGICVQVCPTGIDIRNGLQYECIGCAACIDGCDQVMDKVGYPRG